MKSIFYNLSENIWEVISNIYTKSQNLVKTQWQRTADVALTQWEPIERSDNLARSCITWCWRTKIVVQAWRRRSENFIDVPRAYWERSGNAVRTPCHLSGLHYARTASITFPLRSKYVLSTSMRSVVRPRYTRTAATSSQRLFWAYPKFDHVHHVHQFPLRSIHVRTASCHFARAWWGRSEDVA